MSFILVINLRIVLYHLTLLNLFRPAPLRGLGILGINFLPVRQSQYLATACLEIVSLHNHSSGNGSEDQAGPLRAEKSSIL